MAVLTDVGRGGGADAKSNHRKKSCSSILIALYYDLWQNDEAISPKSTLKGPMISSPESGGSWWNSNPFMFESESEKRKRKRSQPLSVLRGPLLSAAKMRSSLRIFLIFI